MTDALKTLYWENGEKIIRDMTEEEIADFLRPPTPEEIAAARPGMVCSRLQGRLVLGETTCAAIDALAADPDTPWAMRQTISHAIEWRRTSQAMTELGYLLGYTDTQMDDLFQIAMTVEV